MNVRNEIKAQIIRAGMTMISFRMKIDKRL